MSVEKILVIGGRRSFAKTIEQQKFTELNSSTLNYIVGHNFLGNNVSIDEKYAQQIETLLASSKLHFMSKLLVMHFYGRNLKKAKYFKTRAKFILFSRYRVVNLQSFKEVIRHTFTSKTLLLFFILGFLRVPRKIIISILGKFCQEKHKFYEILQELKPSTVLLVDNGDGPMFFLINVTYRSSVRYGLIVYSWDNPTTKLFPTEIFDFIGTWNSNQITELANISNFPPHRTSVIGSVLSDRVRLNSLTSSKNGNNNTLKSRQLLIAGMHAPSDEVMEVLQIAKLLNSGEYFYETLVYRPHPHCSYSLKFIEKNKNEFFNLGVEIKLDNDFNVADFNSVICYPSTLLLEVVAAKKFAVFYTPRYRRWKVDPFKISKADYFDKILELNAITCIENYRGLVSSLTRRLPEVKEFSSSTFEAILPNLQTTFLDRIDSLIKSNQINNNLNK